MWYAICVKEAPKGARLLAGDYAPGQIVSLTDELPAKLGDAFEAFELGDDFDQNEMDIIKEWDVLTKTVVDKVLPVIETKEERIDSILVEILKDVTLSKEDEAKLRDALELKL